MNKWQPQLLIMMCSHVGWNIRKSDIHIQIPTKSHALCVRHMPQHYFSHSRA